MSADAPARAALRSKFGAPVPAVALALVVPSITRLRPARLSRLLLLLSRPRRRRTLANGAVARTERALAIAARFRTQTCLTRGPFRFIMLRRAGMPVELVFGVGPHEEVYAGHCWLELDGEPYLEPRDPRARFPEVFRVGAAA